MRKKWTFENVLTQKMSRKEIQYVMRTKDFAERFGSKGDYCFVPEHFDLMMKVDKWRWGTPEGWDMMMEVKRRCKYVAKRKPDWAIELVSAHYLDETIECIDKIKEDLGDIRFVIRVGYSCKYRGDWEGAMGKLFDLECATIYELAGIDVEMPFNVESPTTSDVTVEIWVDKVGG